MDRLEVPWSGEEGKHPIAIQTGLNPETKRWDLILLVGNFASDKDAVIYADVIADFLRENAEAEMLKRS